MVDKRLPHNHLEQLYGPVNSHADGEPPCQIVMRAGQLRKHFYDGPLTKR